MNLTDVTGGCVWIDPARRGGEPCIGGTSVTTEQVAGDVWNDNGDQYTDPEVYGMSKRQVLVACWYEVRYGQDLDLRPMRKAWEQWGLLAGEMLWHKVVGMRRGANAE